MGNRNSALPSSSCLPADFSNFANSAVKGVHGVVEVPTVVQFTSWME